MKVIYKGQSDAQGFGQADFEKAGLGFTEDVLFPNGSSVEVPDEVGKALISDKGIFADFIFEEGSDPDWHAVDPTPDPDEILDEGEPQLPAEGEEATTEGTATKPPKEPKAPKGPKSKP